MYTVNNDTRIFMTPVTDYDPRTRTHVATPGKAETEFKDSDALIRFLAVHTETKGYADPARWRNDYILRQCVKGRAAKTWTRTVESRWSNRTWTENWDYWFHDAKGRTIDVRLFWPEVVKKVRGGIKKDDWIPRGKRYSRQGRKRHSSSGCYEGKRGRARHYLAEAEREEFFDDDGNFLYRVEPRGKTLMTAQLFLDWDFSSFRAKHSTGWKEHKYRHQWEHRVREREKHQKNRTRKALQ